MAIQNRIESTSFSNVLFAKDVSKRIGINVSEKPSFEKDEQALFSKRKSTIAQLGRSYRSSLIEKLEKEKKAKLYEIFGAEFFDEDKNR